MTLISQSAHDLEGWEECWSLQDLFLRFTFLSNSALPFERPGYQYNMTPEDKTNHLGVEVKFLLFLSARGRVAGYPLSCFPFYYFSKEKIATHPLPNHNRFPTLLSNFAGYVRTVRYPTSRGIFSTSLVL